MTAEEGRVRRAAARQGLKLVKSRRRNRQSVGFGRYWLVNVTTGELVTDDLGVDLAEIAAYLDSQER